ncbi:hypothetical protein N802_13220 [Knoellia sinensis KCTC 19936]|uniref:Uncharacterized protein n=1 Tax=Knoellia sinensis KCTC 19936 TaxID=1385520 RepID=A0A0A0JFR2_9MICO|nr:hypothetical protein N802_13220 [Knoellia sinensis KCTC 19936]
MGEGVAVAGTATAGRDGRWWHERFIVAFGGAVVVLATLIMAGSWTDGLRGSSFDELRQDLRNGAVQEWYVADQLERGTFDRMVAHQTGIVEAPGEPTPDAAGGVDMTVDTQQGGIIVWRAYGAQGWRVATSDVDLDSFGSSISRSGGSPEVAEFVKELREADVPMRPFSVGDGGPLTFPAMLAAAGIFAGLIFGAAPRLGTRWFWFWVMVNGPLMLGFIAYAVVELIGFGRPTDRPLDKRLSGIVGFVGAIALSVAFGIGANALRSWGVPLPL